MNLSAMHMAEFVAGNRKSEFHDWELEKKQRVLRRLRGIIKRHTVKCIGMAVAKSDYEQVSPTIKLKTGSNSTFAVMLTMTMVGRWRLMQAIEEPIEYVFDWLDPNDPRRKQLEEFFENECARGQALQDYGMLSGGYSFRRREDTWPLQAADMLAWLLYNATQETMRIKTVNRLARENFIDLRSYRDKHRWFDAGCLTADQLRGFADQLPASQVFANVKELHDQTKRTK
jgi:hypothetical protein